MAPKAVNSNRKKQKLSINKKLAVLKEFSEGKRVIDIAKQFNMNECTVRAIKKNEERIKMCANNISTRMADKNIHIRNPLIHKFENLLYVWITEQRQRGVSLSTSLIQTKANSLHAAVIATSGESSTTSPFAASRGWFQKFKKRFNLRNLNIHGEAASADHASIEPFKKQLSEAIRVEGYCSKQVYNMDETGLFWKKTSNANLRN